MGEDYSGDIRVFDPLVYQPDASIVDRDDCVGTAGGYVFNEGVRVVV